MNSRVLRVGSIVFVLAAWQASAAVIDNTLFVVPPSTIGQDLWEWTESGEIWVHLKTSGYELVIAFVLAVTVGVLFGLVMGFSRVAADLLEPSVAALYSTPLLALTPLFIIWLGIGVASKIFIIFFIIVFPVIINTQTGVRSVDPLYVEVVRAFGGNSAQITRMARLPSALPFIVASMRIGVSRGTVGVFVAELFGARAGLGYTIQRSSSLFDMPRVWTAIVLLALFGIISTGLLNRFERRVAPWRALEG